MTTPEEKAMVAAAYEEFDKAAIKLFDTMREIDGDLGQCMVLDYALVVGFRELSASDDEDGSYVSTFARLGGEAQPYWRTEGLLYRAIKSIDADDD